MPIKPENKHRYPADWDQIRARILERAAHCCEWPGCGLGNYWFVQDQNGERVVVGFDEVKARTWPAMDEIKERMQGRPIRIVLTIAHLDHVPENVADDNLRAWCQKHHLAYDAGHHQQTAYHTRREGKAIDMFEVNA